MIADDGSKENHFEKIKKYFTKQNFKKYKLVYNEKNKGTVLNLYSALEVCSGEYTKTISPKDAIYGNNTIRNWIDFNKKNNFAWSFSDAIYYQGDFQEKNIISVETHPQDISAYIKQYINLCRWYYFVLNDIALGATMICNTTLQKMYVEKIINKVIYAEDHIWRMMMFDGNVGGYFNQNAVLYEYGSGVSTNGHSIWGERLKNDYDAADKIINQTSNLDKFQKKMLKCYNNVNKNILTKLFTKGKLKQKLTRRFKIRKTINYLP